MIEARGLRREFGARVAVDDVSLSVPGGTLLALLGPNGAGKTTTVRLLAGLLAPTAGEATVAGCDVRTSPAAVRARVGLVTDSPDLHDQMTPLAYLDFFGRMYGLDTQTRRRRIDDMLRLFDLRGVAALRMVGFSRGMQQKVALARALLHEPTVLFLDEPTAGLDPLATRTVRELIVKLKHASRSIVLCTHDLGEAERLSDRVAILTHGRIVAADTPAALRANASQATVVRISLAAPFAAVTSIIQQVRGALDTQYTSSERLLTYRTTEPSSTNPAVVTLLAAAGAEIISVTCATASLEDAYASAVSDRDQAGAGTRE